MCIYIYIYTYIYIYIYTILWRQHAIATHFAVPLRVPVTSYRRSAALRAPSKRSEVNRGRREDKGSFREIRAISPLKLPSLKYRPLSTPEKGAALGGRQGSMAASSPGDASERSLRRNRNPRPQPQTFIKLLFQI